ncbi:MAG: helix-turn-helix transcriptional regulator [Sediminimonas qiaohouensis]|uniref:Helix-turn-helix transcriptional regulator n=1 Tax=Sediminimonas qiaohouensis TaxID=552061 RepID=A0A7C9LQC9_9RHOB|nr:XRE family transcriptional regulator [Sediminimonas qiaohouensis]MTJ05600.1 helix-turn-helix transcriptional regulator [Sediminimonas qiaohouensis]
MPKKLHADTRLAKFIDKRVMELRPRKSQIEIATEAGFVNPNMAAMIKNGTTKLPLDRVPSLARALECDPAYLLRLTLEQAAGDTAANAIVEIMGTPVTRNELGWLQEIREASDQADPRMTARSRAAIRAIFGK